MRGQGFWAFAAALMIVTAAPLLAQDAPERPVATPDSNSSSTKEMGTTGDTGGSRGQTKPGVGSRAISGSEDRDLAADQPEMATGLDLKGPPVRFPAAKTPE
jgi:hypothetical protein